MFPGISISVENPQRRVVDLRSMLFKGLRVFSPLKADYMCGRTSLANVPEELRPYLQLFGVDDVPPWYAPRYNIAPSQDQMVVVERDGGREARAMHWNWFHPARKASGVRSKIIIGRIETAATKPLFRNAYAKRRGLLVVDGYYEWRPNADGTKTPFRFHRDGKPFTLAVLCEQWKSADAVLESFAVLTMEPGDAVRQIHDRMPVTMSEEKADAWLSPETPPAVIRDIAKEPIDRLQWDAVSRYVNNPSHEGEACWAVDKITDRRESRCE